MTGTEEGIHIPGAAAAYWEPSGVPILPFDQANFDRAETRARVTLADARHQSALAAETRRGDAENPLSPRERELLHLLGSGHSDREIAERLYISRRTASHHVAAILRKLDAHSRAAAVQQARHAGII